ncbi:MAG: DUF928 domain-containing protein [Spirulinaceae cyanobacterium]
MTRFKRYLKQFSLIVLIAIGLLLPAWLNSPALSNTNSLTSLLPGEFNFSAPSDIGKPDRRQGGATRSPGECLANEKNQLTALSPVGGSFTMKAYPNFSWYLPANSAQKISFYLMDPESPNDIYYTSYLLAKNNGDASIKEPSKIINLEIPDSVNVAPLEVNKTYSWLVEVYCDSSGARDFWASGEIQRVEPEPAVINQLKQAQTPEARLAIYAQARLLPETLETLFEIERSNPNSPDVQATWQKIISSLKFINPIDDPEVSLSTQ